MSLRSRITLGFVLLVVSSFSLIIYLILKDVRPRYLEAVEESSIDTAQLLAAVISQQATSDNIQISAIDSAMQILSKRSFLARIYEVEKQSANLTVYITDNRGILLYDSTKKAAVGSDFSKWNDVYLTLQDKYGARSTRTIPDDPTSSTIYVAAPIEKEGKLLGVVSIGKPKNSVSFFVEVAKRKFLLALVLIGLSAVGLAIVLSSWITQPIRSLIEYVNAIKQGNPKRLPDLGSSEIGTLATALEEMRIKLEGKNYIEDYVRTLTHEMKSPLTGIRGASEILRDDIVDEKGIKFLNNIDTEAARLENLVERMLQLSRLENVRTLNKDKVSIEEVIREVSDAFQSQLQKKKITLEVMTPNSLFIEGDSFLLHQAIGNLVSNAIDFAPPNSKIQTTAHSEGGKLTISVKDSGPGIPDFALSKVFDKFFSLERPDTGKKSTGLGLPFVKEVASLHGGDVKLKNMNPGLEVTVSLPSSWRRRFGSVPLIEV